ncbi:hypothetical protein GGR57DRAFT_520753 [Xylariaceae sp. FL1272]|nr:hypothetical protein GGR57DRAFT_520753 [Xylariaceae sp. FL1272]
MKFLLTAALAGLSLASDAIDPFQAACPTITKEVRNPTCTKGCGSSDCRIISTVSNFCGCPSAVPVATLLAPCDAQCPYGGCGIEYRTATEKCTTSRTRHTSTPTPTPTPPTPTSTSTSTSTSVTWIITTVPGKPTVTPKPCPTVTLTTRPAGCDPIRCPIPSCTEEREMDVPCGCDIKTLLAVEGCQTACSTGCATRTVTSSALCATATPHTALPPAPA